MVLKSPHGVFDLTSIAILTTITLIFALLIALLCHCIDLYIRCRNPLPPSPVSHVDGLVGFLPSPPPYFSAATSLPTSLDDIVLVILPFEKEVNLACGKPIL
jgi:hypothetical protein